MTSKKVKFFLATLILFVAVPAGAYFNPGKPAGFVNDYANLLSAEQKQSLEQKLSQFEKDSTVEISVVTISSLQGDTIENFAVELFKEWGIGKKDKDNGILILVALEDRKMRIEVGYGLEEKITDAQSSWIINDVMKPAFKNIDYYQGINGAVDKIMAAAKGEDIVPQNSSAASEEKNGPDWMIIIYVIGIVLVWLASMLARSRSWWFGGIVGGFIGVLLGAIAGSWLWLSLITVGSIVVGLLFDYIVSTTYAKGKKAGHVPWWVGGGGFGGGSGGGFGGFGGGGSGGGGSSGSW